MRRKRGRPAWDAFAMGQMARRAGKPREYSGEYAAAWLQGWDNPDWKW